MTDQLIVSAHEYLRQQGTQYIVFHPGARLLYFGFGSDEAPRVVPHCVAVNTSSKTSAASAPTCNWAPDQHAYETLAEVHRVLHLQPPPPPEQQQQTAAPSQQHQNGDQPSSQAAAGSQPAVATAASGDAADPYPAAKAGIISSRQVPEGSDGFAWSITRRAGAATGNMVPCLPANQASALWPGEPYSTLWLMTEDGHITDFDTTPERILLERFEAVWRWALSVELGVSPAQQQKLAAVLLVHHDMTASEVRLLADVLLDRLGFSSLVVHLAPVAATFGNGATSACVVDMTSGCSSIVCVDDATVLPPQSSRLHVGLGLTGVVAALVGWMGCYRHWPLQLQQQGLGLGCVLPGGSAYGALMLEEMAVQQCYFPKESFSLGLVGQAMLEENPPASLPIRVPGSPTVNCQLSLGSWAAVASMVYFYPDLAPNLQQLQHVVGAADADASSVDALQDSGAGVAAAAAGSSNSNALSGADGMVVDSSSSSLMGPQYQHYHSCVHHLPAAEAMYLQGQLKARLEAGMASAPPVGLYLPALDISAAAGATDGTDAAAAAAAEYEGGPGSITPSEPLHRSGSAAAAAVAAAQASKTVEGAAAAMGAGEAAAGAVSMMPLDEAVFKSITAVAAGRPDVCERLCNGILLIGPGAGLRGLGQMLERRVMQRFSSAGRQQVVNVLEHRAHPAHLVWKGGALLAALDGSRDNWLPRHQWVQGGMVVPAPAAAQQPGAGRGAAAAAAAAAAGGAAGAAAGAGSLSNAAAGRHAKLFYYLKAEQGLA